MTAAGVTPIPGGTIPGATMTAMVDATGTDMRTAQSVLTGPTAVIASNVIEGTGADEADGVTVIAMHSVAVTGRSLSPRRSRSGSPLPILRMLSLS
jgi:uncharacterized protein (DUF4213/DUF364 family)